MNAQTKNNTNNKTEEKTSSTSDNLTNATSTIKSFEIIDDDCDDLKFTYSFHNKTSNNALMISNIQSYNLCNTKSSINIYYNSILQ